MDRASVLENRPGSGAPARYRWSFPGSPVDVRLSLGMVEKLRQDLDHRRETTAAHGLLFGRMLGNVTEIDSYTLLPGPPLAAAVKQAPGTSALVGYFRTASEAVLKLDSADLKIAETVLPDPGQVILLIQSDPANASHAPNASFFFRDEGRICGDFPFLEFPFDRALLAAAELRRTETAPRNHAATAARLSGEAASAPVHALPHGRPRRARNLVLALAAVVLIVGVGAATIAALRLFRPANPSARSTPAQPPIVLGLHAERENGDLKLTWDRQSLAIIGALSGVLSIEEAGARRSLTLDPALLRSGNVVYAPVSDQVHVQLTVFGMQGSVSESAVVILPQGRTPEVRTLALKVAPAAPEPPAAPPSPAPPPHRGLFRAPATGPDVGSAPAPMAMDQPPAVSMRIDRPTLALAAIEPAPPQVQPYGAPSRVEALAAPAYSPPSVSRRVVPPYSDALRALMAVSTTKTVAVKVSIDEKGDVRKVEALPNPNGRTPAIMLGYALNAARGWKFNPARIGPKAVASEMEVRFEFKLEQ